MFRDTITIQKSKSCPADFSEEDISRAVAALPRTPPVSNGARMSSSSSTRRKSSISKAPHSASYSFAYSLNGNNNGTSTMTMNERISSANATGSPSSPEKAVPGRPRRRGGNRNAMAMMPKRKKNPSQSLRYRLMNARWMKNPMGKGGANSAYYSLMVAVFLWYSLGVISITTSNLLMMEPKNHVGGVPPLFLTFQQLVIGQTLLQFLLRIRFLGSPGIQPWPSPSAAAQAAEKSRRKNLLFNNTKTTNSNNFSDLISSNLVLAGVCFAMGFLATNSGFLASSAAFVETVKAAEPITSAMVAVMWRIETLSGPETLSLGSIVAGVLISTLAHSTAHSSSNASVGSSLIQSLQSCMVVMTANLCFSFRGLYQKLFRASPEGSSQVVDDLNLQLRMQQIGVMLLVVPVIVFDLPAMSASMWELTYEIGLIRSGALFRYMGLALVNGVAFTSYNLASTYILTRISVVHHAALNCIRRIFAIIVTSLFFRIPITVLGIFGFFVSFGGFMSFTHYKIQRQKQPKPLSSLLPVSALDGDKGNL